MITNKKTFTLGLFLMLSFIAIFAVMMSPIYGNGRNGLEFADDMFNSLSKGSANFMQSEQQKADKLTGTAFEVNLAASDSAEAQKWNSLYTAAGATVNISGTDVNIKGDMGQIFSAVLADCKAMYNNSGDVLSGKYGLEGREATYAWYTSLKGMDKAFEKQKLFQEQAAVQSLVKKAVEPAYNYYGIEAKQVADNKVMLFLLMSFYLVYTLWYGFAFYFLFDGLGIATTKAAKKAEA